MENQYRVTHRVKMEIHKGSRFSYWWERGAPFGEDVCQHCSYNQLRP